MRKTVVALGSALTLCAPNFGYAGEFGGIGISLGGQVALPIRDQVDPPQGYGCISGIAHFGRKIWRAGGEIGACGNPLEGNVVMAGLNHGFTKLFGPMYLTGYNTLGLSYWRADIDLNSPPSWRSDSPARFRAVTAYLKPQLGVGIPLPAGAIEVSAYVSLHAPIAQWIPSDAEPVRVLPTGGLEVAFLWGDFRKRESVAAPPAETPALAPLPGSQPAEVQEAPRPPATAVEPETEDRPLAIPADKR